MYSYITTSIFLDFPGGSDGKEFACNARDPAMRQTWFNPWVGKTPWRREWLPTPVSGLENSIERRSLAGYSACGCKESDTTEWLSLTSPPLSVKNWAANTINVYCSLFQISLLFQDIFLNWFSPKVFPPLLCFLFVLLLPQVWSVSLNSEKEFQLSSIVFGFICIPWVYWLATTFIYLFIYFFLLLLLKVIHRNWPVRFIWKWVCTNSGRYYKPIIYEP